MKQYKVVFSPAALSQMGQLGQYIAQKAGEKTALAYIADIQKHCQDLKTFPHRGTKRDDLHPTLRVIGHRKRASIAFSVYPDHVVIQGISYGGQNIDSLPTYIDTI